MPLKGQSEVFSNTEVSLETGEGKLHDFSSFSEGEGKFLTCSTSLVEGVEISTSFTSTHYK